MSRRPGSISLKLTCPQRRIFSRPARSGSLGERQVAAGRCRWPENGVAKVACAPLYSPAGSVAAEARTAQKPGGYTGSRRHGEGPHRELVHAKLSERNGV